MAAVPGDADAGCGTFEGVVVGAAVDPAGANASLNVGNSRPLRSADERVAHGAGISRPSHRNRKGMTRVMLVIRAVGYFTRFDRGHVLNHVISPVDPFPLQEIVAA